MTSGGSRRAICPETLKLRISRRHPHHREKNLRPHPPKKTRRNVIGSEGGELDGDGTFDHPELPDATSLVNKHEAHALGDSERMIRMMSMSPRTLRSSAR